MDRMTFIALQNNVRAGIASPAQIDRYESELARCSGTSSAYETLSFDAEWEAIGTRRVKLPRRASSSR